MIAPEVVVIAPADVIPNDADICLVNVHEPFMSVFELVAPMVIGNAAFVLPLPILIAPSTSLSLPHPISISPSVCAPPIFKFPVVIFAPNVKFPSSAELPYAGDVILVPTSTDDPEVPADGAAGTPLPHRRLPP